MAPTEAQVLTSYLVRPAALDAMLTQEAFESRFPPSQRDSPAVRALWADLVSQRERLLDDVRAAIEAEAARGQVMRREVLRARREAQAAEHEPDGEVDLERAMLGNLAGREGKHGLEAAAVELEGAADVVEAEMARLQDEERGLREAVAAAVGGLSDLRYGRFGNGRVARDTGEALTALREACEDKAR